MSVRRAAAAALALLALAGCRGDRPDWRVTQLYGGPGSVEVIAHPELVEAFRIDPDAREPRPGVEYVGLHRVLSGPVAAPDETAQELTSVLLDAGTYDWHRAKGCEFRPGVGLRFTRRVSRVDVALCFECDMLTAHRQGRRVGVEDFDDARPRLVAAVKRLFPDDAEIQALEP